MRYPFVSIEAEFYSISITHWTCWKEKDYFHFTKIHKKEKEFVERIQTKKINNDKSKIFKLFFIILNTSDKRNASE